MALTDILFRPFSYKGFSLRNRIVMAPMTRQKSPGGVPTDEVAQYYARRAANEVGLIVTEGTTVGRQAASSSPDIPNFYKPDALQGWKNVVEQVHAEGGVIFPQLWHEGMMRREGTGPYSEAPSDSPSGVTHKGKQIYTSPSEEEVADMVAAYVKSAQHAKKLGFDGIEFHGAHGYLIDQFFWDRMNIRADRYGGDLQERARFAAELIAQTRAAVGEDFPLILRFSQWKQQDFSVKLADGPEQLEKFLSVLVDAGVDMFHCSTRRFWEPEFEASDLNLAGWVKKLTGQPTISVGSVGLARDFLGAVRHGEGSQRQNLDALVERMERDEFDLIAVGRALLQDPEWARKVKEGRQDEINDFDAASRDILY